MGLTMFVHDYLMQAVYFAPRGKKPLLFLGTNIQQRYLRPDDKLIGFVGDAGAGKSLLIRGMFPGLELTNDDEGINVRPLPLMEDAESGRFRYHTYHLDVRFEAAFTQPWKMGEAVLKAIASGKRVVVEHFELIYEQLGINAEVLIGIGGEVIVTRPTMFGPEPREIANLVFESIKYRRMAHSAEDLTTMVLESIGLPELDVHCEIKYGFVLELAEKPDFSLELVERRVLDLIEADLPISFVNEAAIKIGDTLYPCSGPRIHVRRTGEIIGFNLVKEFLFDSVAKVYTMVGMVGDDIMPAASVNLFAGHRSSC